MLHAYSTGLKKPINGATHHWSQITDSIAMEIYNWKGKGRDAAKKYGVHECTVSAIKKKRNWKHIHAAPIIA